MTRFENVGVFTPTFSNIVIFHTYPPMKMEQTECSETSAYKIQTPGNYPEESIQHSEHGESLKSRIFKNSFFAEIGDIAFMLQKQPINSFLEITVS